MNPRRRVLFAGVGLAAIAAGSGLALWRRQSEPAPDAQAPVPEPSLWSHTFETPSGPPLAMNTLSGRPVLLNFWATWCPPCIKELPLLDGFHREHGSTDWQVIGLAIDQREAVVDFLKLRPVTYPIALAGADGLKLSRSLGNAAGGMPFTIVFDRAGQAVAQKLGAVTAEDLAAWRAALALPKKAPFQNLSKR